MPLSPYLKIVDPAAPCTTMPATLATTYTFPLDPFQQHAIAAISRNENVLVTAKTGSGKTLVGEYQIAHSLKRGRRVFYTTPIKSLSNQKFYDLKQLFPDRVGIMTGDIKFKPDADIVIMTTEILRNLLFKRGTATEHIGLTAALSLDRLDAVVFDECHYINDRDRGSVWEETMILLPPEVNLVLLSATIDAPEQFASWLGELKQKPIHLISTQYRIVPLVHGVYRGDELLTVMDAKDRFEAGTYRAWLLWRAAQEKEQAAHAGRVADRRRGGYEDGPVRRAGGLKSFTHELNGLVGRLDTQGLLPALVFVFSRKDCERYARLVEHTLIDSSDAATVRHIIQFHLHRYSAELEHLEQYYTLCSLLEKGIAFHHSGLLPILKEIVEILFSRGYVKLLFATETFAVGINMPTKTVVFTGFRKYDDHREGMRLLNTDEYIQMAGRAGRRGKDDKGLVLYLPDREPEELDDMKRMMMGARSTFQSRMNFHYDFLLKTLQTENLRWMDLMRQSYWFCRHEQVLACARKDLAELEARQQRLGITAAEAAGLEEFERLSAMVKQTVNAARREAQRALEAWNQRHVGPRWHTLQKELWPTLRRLRADAAALQGDIAEMEAPDRDVQPTLEVLQALGYLEAGDSTKLSAIGRLATEVNEGHPILMTHLFGSAIRRELQTPQEVLAALAIFVGEGPASQEDCPAIHELRVPGVVRDCIVECQRAGARGADVERQCGAAAPPKATYWEVNWRWVEPVWRWVQGDVPLGRLAAEYGTFEGNFTRILSKVGNLLEEWRSLATLTADVEALEVVRDASSLLQVGLAATDSLYLRL